MDPFFVWLLFQYFYLLMVKTLSSILVIVAVLSCTEQNENIPDEKENVEVFEETETQPSKVVEQDNISIEVYDFENIQPFIYKNNDRINVVNFWATWCVPCIQELPAFEKLKAENPEVDMTLISMDFTQNIESDLIPFIIKNNIQSDVVVLDDPDANSWIPKVDENWSGAIPATIIYNKDKRVFYERSFTYEELAKEVQTFKK